jgi:threonine dehydratase
MNNTNHRLSIENIEDVIKIINPIFLNSPQFECKSLNETLGLNLIIKNEIENPVKCLKQEEAKFLFRRQNQVLI